MTLQMTGHKTRSVFERYNIVSECDLVEDAKKLNLLQSASALSALRRDKLLDSPTDTNREDGPAAPERRSGEVGHNPGTIEPDRGSRLKVSL